ncbi:MAG: PEGA domain-containing protein [Deltaproteobacteria bacterium]|nr:PEGA domain-containing protein [Deltaproteobacteria bacterium]
MIPAAPKRPLDAAGASGVAGAAGVAGVAGVAGAAGALLALVLALACCSTPKRDASGKPVSLGKLRLRTFPAGAKVWIDGELKVESTPATLVLAEGRYQLTIQLAGAEALAKEIEIVAGEASELNLNVPRPPDATVTVLSDAVGARVLINGYARGETPLVSAVTKPGPIDVTVLEPGGHAKSARTTLAIGEEKWIELFFGDTSCAIPVPVPPPVPMSSPPPLGAITLGLEPPGIVLNEEGRALGETPLVSYPMPTGEHRLLLRSKDGRFEKWVTVEVEAEKAAIYRLRLRQEDEVEGWQADAGSPDAGASRRSPP